MFRSGALFGRIKAHGKNISGCGVYSHSLGEGLEEVFVVLIIITSQARTPANTPAVVTRTMLVLFFHTKRERRHRRMPQCGVIPETGASHSNFYTDRI
eukprot:scaffold4201_cov178-Amphora_coffeaeformis.AAC.12